MCSMDEKCFNNNIRCGSVCDSGSQSQYLRSEMKRLFFTPLRLRHLPKFALSFLFLFRASVLTLSRTREELILTMPPAGDKDTKGYGAAGET
jgi:hypothetical protein